MSYRIAYVRFRAGERTYPVNCNRADLEVGDLVIVDMNEGSDFKTARIAEIVFKNWNCKNTIFCLRDELKTDKAGKSFVEITYRAEGLLHSVEDVYRHLESRGWVHHKPKQSTWRAAYTLVRSSESVTILFRKNGIDFRMRDKSVAHWYHESEVDLYVFCLDFANDFEIGAKDHERFFVAKGQPFQKPATAARDDLSDIYDVVSGNNGGPAYLGDGVWLGPGGRVWSD